MNYTVPCKSVRNWDISAAISTIWLLEYEFKYTCNAIQSLGTTSSTCILNIRMKVNLFQYVLKGLVVYTFNAYEIFKQSISYAIWFPKLIKGRRKTCSTVYFNFIWNIDTFTHRLLSVESWVAAMKYFVLVCQCLQFLSGLLVNDHLPRVSLQSRLSPNDTGNNEIKLGLCTYLMAFTLRVGITPENLS